MIEHIWTDSILYCPKREQMPFCPKALGGRAGLTDLYPRFGEVLNPWLNRLGVPQREALYAITPIQ